MVNVAAHKRDGLVKVCGVTSIEDAELAASSGANLIGMILWPKAKRSVSADTARNIADVARKYGAEPVAVFVDEDAATIDEVCREAHIKIAQLHGEGARSALCELSSNLQVVYVLHADKDGSISTSFPPQLTKTGPDFMPRQVEWILLDSLKGGSGESFDWKQLSPPVDVCTRGWLLAGGLNPDNVAEAIETANPCGVDVSSGVCGPDGLKKDAQKVFKFVKGAHAAFNARQS